MNIAWLQDDPGYTGGAELNSQAIRQAVPDNITIADYPPGAPIPGNADMVILQNCAQYPASIIPTLEGKPVYKMCHDVWNEGDPALRDWICANAAGLVMVSPTIKDRIPATITCPVYYAPSAIDTARFEAASQQVKSGAVFVGRLHLQKGIREAILYAEQSKLPIDVYGFGDSNLVFPPAVYRGQVSQHDLPGVLGKYETFVFLPQTFDACPRVIFEARYAGCEIVTNGLQGATWWIDNELGAIENAAALFWRHISIGIPA